MTRSVKAALSIYFVFLFCFIFWGNQSHFLTSWSCYTGLFIAYAYLVHNRQYCSVEKWETYALAAAIIPFLTLPQLSPDFYRFLWDGELTSRGIHPYAFTPNEIMEQSTIKKDAVFNKLYENITLLSRQHYSPYPTVSQIYYVVATLFTDNIILATTILRMLVLGTLIVGVRYLKKLLALFALPSHNVMIVILNPLIIIEVVGNLHFEGVVACSVITGIYFMLQKKHLVGSLFWSLAIAIKLTPLLLLPLFWRYFGARRSLLYYGYITLFSIAILLAFLWPPYVANFLRSITLYFNNFEFNGSIFEVIQWIVERFKSESSVTIAGPITSVIAFIAILGIALIKRPRNKAHWLSKMEWSYLVFLLLGTTVHPWYIILPLCFTVFTKNKFTWFWSYLIFLSYGFYAFPASSTGSVLIFIEYGVLLLILVNAQLSRPLLKSLP